MSFRPSNLRYSPYEITIILGMHTDSQLFSNWFMRCVDFSNVELSLIPEFRINLTDPKVIKELVTRLPKVSSFLIQKIDY